MNQNQYPNRGNRPQPRTGQNGQQVPNGVRRSAAPDPRREAARRAYYAKRRRQKRRARIILAVSLILVLALFAFLVFMIVKGIRAAFSDGKPNVPEDTGKTPVISDQIGTDQTPDTFPAVIGTDTEAAPGTEAPVQPDTPQTEPPKQPAEAPETTELIGPPAPPKVEENDEPVYQLDFKADLTDFEKYMDPEDRDAYLVLVNADHPLGANDAPDDLVDVVNTRTDGRATQKMRKVAEKALEALYKEAYAENMMSAASPSGYPLSVTSAYRDYGTQKYLFNQYTQNEMNRNPALSQAQAEAIVVTYSCRPGTSEHQTGLCCDMHNLSGADVSFARQDVAKWLADNAWKFGFILRFPEDKTAVTGISYEPWHFRFVGRYHAYKIHEAGMCLEEYVAQLGN